MIRITNRDESLGKHGMSTGKRTATTRCVPLVLLLLIVFMAGSAGCIKVVQTTLSGGAAGNANGAPVVTEPPTSVVTPIDIAQSTPTPIPAAVQTPNQSTVITEVTPFVTPNPYVFPQAVQINETPQYSSFLYRQPEFTKTYTLIGNGNAFGLMVNVVKAPLYIVFTVKPKYDCLENPDSCRGTVLVPVNSPYMTITVRDNQTHEIVARDGYGGIYSLRYR